MFFSHLEILDRGLTYKTTIMTGINHRINILGFVVFRLTFILIGNV